MKSKNKLLGKSIRSLPLILLFILLFIIFILSKINQSQLLGTLPTPITASTLKFLEPISEERSDWKTYSDKRVSFQYPPQWFPKQTTEFKDLTVEFYAIGTTPDQSYGDHRGNEVFVYSTIEEKSSLSDLKKNIPGVEEITVAGKPAIKSETNLKILLENRLLNFGVTSDANSSYFNQIISTIKIL